MPITTVVGTSLTTIAQTNAKFAEFLAFQIANGATAFNAFQVQARAETTAPWVVIKDSSYTSSAGFTPAWATAELATLAISGNAILYVLGKHAFEIRLQASVASGTSTVIVYSNSGA
jgi:hypothetical protein